MFVQALEEELARRGREAGARGPRQQKGREEALLASRPRRAERGPQLRPDVVYAHFLVPTGLLAALASRAPLVVTAHGRDVRNVGAFPGIRAATRVVRRAAAVVAVSDYLRHELETKVPEARGKVEVVDCGVDLEQFRVEPAPEGQTAYLCVGSLIDARMRCGQALPSNGSGTLTFVGDGPLRGTVETRPASPSPGASRTTRFRVQVAQARRLPAEPDRAVRPRAPGRHGGRSIGRRDQVGAPPEFVPPAAGALVDPTDVEDIARGMACLPTSPAERCARAAAEEHDLRRQVDPG